MRRWLVLGFCAVLIFAGAFPALADETSKEELTLDPYLFEYFEYETIALAPYGEPTDENWRKLYLEKVEKYLEFLKKYPDSPLRAEVKLRIAELYKDIEKEEVYPFRLEMHRCAAEHSDDNGGTLEERKDCIIKFDKDIGKWRDPVYVQKAVNLLLELVRDYGHMRRYSLVDKDKGLFEWVDEEIGAQALYLLSKGTDPENKKKILLLILREYKAGPKLLFEINEDLEKLPGEKIK